MQFKRLSVLLLVVLSLCSLTACQTAKPYKPDLSAWNTAEFPKTETFQPWQRFLFDVQVVSRDGHVLPQVKKYAVAHRGTTRVLSRPGAIGHSRASANEPSMTSVQAGTGLWFNKHLSQQQAFTFVEVEWPSELGDAPEDMSKAYVKSWISCEPWAQALAINKAIPSEYAVLKKALDSNMGHNRVVGSQFLAAPYKLGEDWVLPILIILDSNSFEKNCLK